MGQDNPHSFSISIAPANSSAFMWAVFCYLFLVAVLYTILPGILAVAVIYRQVTVSNQPFPLSCLFLVLSVPGPMNWFRRAGRRQSSAGRVQWTQGRGWTWISYPQAVGSLCHLWGRQWPALRPIPISIVLFLLGLTHWFLSLVSVLIVIHPQY